MPRFLVGFRFWATNTYQQSTIKRQKKSNKTEISPNINTNDTQLRSTLVRFCVDWPVTGDQVTSSYRDVCMVCIDVSIGSFHFIMFDLYY
jgi:hypothetical protein